MSDPVAAASESPPRLWQRLPSLLHRHRLALALLSFGAGLGSFLLVQRRESVAQWLSVLLLLGWLLMLGGEGAARRLRLPPALLRYGIQATQQETFFFTLPFFLHTTTWTTGQAAFTGSVIVAALCVMWDPVYYRLIVPRTWLYLAFHALAAFVATLTVAPMLLHLTTQQALLVASASVAVLAVPSLLHLIDRSRPLHWFMLYGGALALAALAWQLRPFVPPATLWVQDAAFTEHVDPVTRAPSLALASVSPAQLHQQGLYAYTSIRAPRGLREPVWHRWLLDGREVDRIKLNIVGGRAEGYRAWSFKRGFPEDPRGDWQVEVVTEAGQLIGRFGFAVIGPSPEPAAPAAKEVDKL